jgi:hypothetical protein
VYIEAMQQLEMMLCKQKVSRRLHLKGRRQTIAMGDRLKKTLQNESVGMIAALQQSGGGTKLGQK